MKKLLLPLLLLILSVPVFSQVDNGKLPFQGKLTSGGVPVTGSRTMVFSIPSIEWTETHEVAILDGYYSVVLGSTEANGLPAGLFDEASEIQLNISVGGTALSPVTIYAPLRQKVTLPINLTTTGADTTFAVNLTGETAGTAMALRAKSSTTGRNRAVYAEIEELADNANNQYAVVGSASGPGSGNHIGVFGSTSNAEATGTGSRYGVYGQTSSKFKYNYGTYGYAAGTGNGDAGEGYGVGSINFGAYGYAQGNEWSNTGMEGYAGGTEGASNYGIHGLSEAGTSDTVRNHGVTGRAFGPGVNYGLYGQAYSGVENWAGWFEGDMNVNGALYVNGELFAGGEGGSTDSIKSKNLQLIRENGEKAIELQFIEGAGGKGLFTYDEAGNSPPAGWFGNDAQDRGFVQLVDWTNQSGALLSGFWTGMPSYYLEDWASQWRAILTMDSVSNFGTGGSLRLAGELGAGEREFFNLHLASDEGGVDASRASGELMMHGPTTPNFQLAGKTWENNDLAYFSMYGSHDDGGGWFQTNLTMEVIDVFGDGATNSGFIALANTQSGGIRTTPVEITGAFQGSSGGGIVLRDGSDIENVQIDGGFGNITISGALDANEVFTSSGTVQTSDRRFKKDIQPLEHALENTRKLKGVSYYWKDQAKSQDLQIGVIAQEVEEVYPEFVHTREDGMKGVNYSQMVAVLIEAIKELDAKVVSLEAENAQLKSELSAKQQDELDELRGEIEQIKALLVKPSNTNTSVGSVNKQ